MLIWHIIQYMMPYYCGATVRRLCPRATHSSPQLMGLWQPCRPLLFPWQLPPRLLYPDLRCVSATQKHSAFCHVRLTILLARHFVRWWGLWSAAPLIRFDSAGSLLAANIMAVACVLKNWTIEEQVTNEVFLAISEKLEVVKWSQIRFGPVHFWMFDSDWLLNIQRCTIISREVQR